MKYQITICQQCGNEFKTANATNYTVTRNITIFGVTLQTTL
jgi:uncharacterized protein (DUF983 family)